MSPKARLVSKVSWLFVTAALLCGCSGMNASSFKREDDATLVLTMVTSSGLPPGLLLERADNRQALEFVFAKGSDKILGPDSPESESVTVGMIRHLQPGEYLLTGTSLGPKSGPFSFARKFHTPLRLTLNARETHYLGSYRVNLKEAPGANTVTNQDGVTVVTGGLEITTSVTDNMQADLIAFASVDPHANVASARNVTPDPGK